MCQNFDTWIVQHECLSMPSIKFYCNLGICFAKELNHATKALKLFHEVIFTLKKYFMQYCHEENEASWTGGKNR